MSDIDLLGALAASVDRARAKTCVTCKSVEEHGGPGHNNQNAGCQYLPRIRNHCTCEACY